MESDVFFYRMLELNLESESLNPHMLESKLLEKITHAATPEKIESLTSTTKFIDCTKKHSFQQLYHFSLA